MNRFHRLQGLTMGTILLPFLWLAGCARPAEFQNGESTAQAAQHQVPFHAENRADNSGDSATDDSGPNAEKGLPFHDAKNLPAGTLLTVRLKGPISAENPSAHSTFEAVVDEPVVIDGNQLLPRGATVAGRVESARASNLKRNHGYVRLILDSIQVGGLSLPVQTSSLFVRGNAGRPHLSQAEDSEGQGSVIRLESGRRLIFRLTEPVFVAASRSTAANH